MRKLLCPSILGWAALAQTWEHEPTEVLSKTPVGCFLYGFKFTPGMTPPGNLEDVPDVITCQRWCQNTTGCAHFGYFPSTRACWLGGEDAVAEEDPLAVSGPRHCEDGEAVLACTEKPHKSFPGADASASHALFDSGLVPTKLQCWPRDEQGSPKLCIEEPVTVLADVEQGWRGTCQGLQEVSLPDGMTCLENCTQNVACASWHVTVGRSTVPNSTGRDTCWQGFGAYCEDEWRPPAEALAAYTREGQRLMHGHYRVLKNLTGIQVMKLQNVFKATATANTSEAVSTCRNYCLSLLSCEVWQYSTWSGCWMENPAVEAIEYPPTAANFKSTSNFARTIVAGEYLQRLCGDVAHVHAAHSRDALESSRHGPEDAAPLGSSGGGLPAWTRVLLALLVVMGIAGVAVAFLIRHRSGHGKTKKAETREVTAVGQRPRLASNMEADEASPLMEEVTSSLEYAPDPQLPLPRMPAMQMVPTLAESFGKVDRLASSIRLPQAPSLQPSGVPQSGPTIPPGSATGLFSEPRLPVPRLPPMYPGLPMSSSVPFSSM